LGTGKKTADSGQLAADSKKLLPPNKRLCLLPVASYQLYFPYAPCSMPYALLTKGGVAIRLNQIFMTRVEC